MKKLDLGKKEENNRSTILNKANLSQRKEESKNNILEIMKKDYRSAFSNPIVILLLLAYYTALIVWAG